MDILIGISLALIALLGVFAFWIWSREAFDNLRSASTSTGLRAIVGFALAIGALLLAFSVADRAGQKFGWWDEAIEMTCSHGYQYVDGKQVGESTSCESTEIYR